MIIRIQNANAALVANPTGNYTGSDSGGSSGGGSSGGSGSSGSGGGGGNSSGSSSGNHFKGFLSSWTKKPTSRGGGGCFSAGTKILLANDSLKNIEDIQIGDLVKAYDTETN